MLLLCVSFQEVHSSAVEVEEYYFTKHEDLILRCTLTAYIIPAVITKHSR